MFGGVVLLKLADDNVKDIDISDPLLSSKLGKFKLKIESANTEPSKVNS